LRTRREQRRATVREIHAQGVEGLEALEVLGTRVQPDLAPGGGEMRGENGADRAGTDDQDHG
jgi:hypothetical protein